ncbi:MAG: YjfB family protein [Lachnospiraceae bacterium]|nr:YjfB family protein [Lachnospiraceae bacterium]
MDIEGLSMALAQNKVMTDVSTQVLAMSLEHMEETGAEITEMLNESLAEAPAVPGVGGNLDITI